MGISSGDTGRWQRASTEGTRNVEQVPSNNNRTEDAARLADQTFEASTDSARPADVDAKSKGMVSKFFGGIHDYVVEKYQDYRAHKSEKRMAKIDIEMPYRGKGYGKDELILQHKHSTVFKESVVDYIFDPDRADPKKAAQDWECEQTFAMMFGKKDADAAQGLMPDILANGKVAMKLNLFLSNFGSFETVDNVEHDHFEYNETTRVIKISSTILQENDSATLMKLLDSEIVGHRPRKPDISREYTVGPHAAEVRMLTRQSDEPPSERSLMIVAMFGFNTPVRTADIDRIVADPELKAEVLNFLAEGGNFEVYHNDSHTILSFDFDEQFIGISAAALTAKKELLAEWPNWVDQMREIFGLESPQLDGGDQIPNDEIERAPHVADAPAIAPDQAPATVADTQDNDEVERAPHVTGTPAIAPDQAPATVADTQDNDEIERAPHVTDTPAIAPDQAPATVADTQDNDTIITVATVDDAAEEVEAADTQQDVAAPTAPLQMGDEGYVRKQIRIIEERRKPNPPEE